jgi:carboxyl-terminal processing protease
LSLLRISYLNGVIGMQKFGCIALAVSLSLTSVFLCAKPVINTDKNAEVPKLHAQDQHKTASKRIVAQFTRAHYKPVKIDDALSEQVFDRYIKQLDFSRNVFLAKDIESFEKYRDDFDNYLSRGDLDVPFDIYNLNMQRRLERYQYAISLLDKPFNFTLDESYNFDRENAPWPQTEAELNELWRQKVKYDALNLTLAGKEWPKVKEILTKRYHYAIKRLTQGESEDAFQLLMNSFARVVEPHTSYLSPRNAERFQMDMNLSLEGIGAVLRPEDDYTTVVSVVSGGPADKSKELKPNDRIVGVAQNDDDFVDVIGWRLDDVVDLIKGPKGTKVRLQVLPSESDDDASIKVVSIIRDKIKLEDRAAKSEIYIDKSDSKQHRKLGVITIPSFYNNLSSDVKKEIANLQKEAVEGIIIDLRGNGGGSLSEATLLTGLFIDKGPVVQIRDGANRISVNADRDGVAYYDGPLTVMVDRYSASASEIFAAAIQDYGRGIIIGEHTFGKGTVQQHRPLGRIYDLFEHPLGSIQYTIAKFYRINGGSTQHRGVLPDIAFPTAVDPEDWGESKEENALPWDQIPKARYQKLSNLNTDINYLTSLYKQRIKNNREFNYLLEDIKVYQQEKDDKSVSLNLAIRKAKREEAKAKRLKRVNERLITLGKKPVTSLDDLPEELDKLDPFLDEAAKITLDYANLGKYAKK